MGDKARVSGGGENDEFVAHRIPVDQLVVMMDPAPDISCLA